MTVPFQLTYAGRIQYNPSNIRDFYFIFLIVGVVGMESSLAF